MNKTISEEELLEKFENNLKKLDDYGDWNIPWGTIIDEVEDILVKVKREAYKAGQQQTLKDFVSELKEHTVKVDNERAVKVSMIERLLIKYIK